MTTRKNDKIDVTWGFAHPSGRCRRSSEHLIGPLHGKQDKQDAESLYDTLENEIIPLYYKRRSNDDLPVEWIARMKESIRTLAPQFSMRRMVKEYVGDLYVPAINGGCKTQD